MQRRKLPWTTVIGYGLGDIFGGGSTTTINMFYLFFLTDVARIDPGLAGLAILISKIWDAVTDPFMGIISDNTRTRFGRRRPYFLAGIGAIFLSFSAMWLTVPLDSEFARFLFYLMTYLLFSTVYTMVWVPYNAISAELTPDYDERTKLGTARILFSNMAGIACALTARDLFVNVLSPGDPARGFALMAVAFGLFYSLPYIITFRTCTENPAFMSTPKRRIENLSAYVRKQFIDPFRLRPFRNVALMYLFGFMVVDSVTALAVYLLTYYLKVESVFLLLAPVYVGMLTMMPVVGLISRRIGKRETYLAAGALWLLAFAFVPFLTPGGSMAFVVLFGLLFGFGASGVQVMVFSMFPDVPDADEVFSGVRREGVYSGIFAFLRKAGSAVTIFIIGQSLNWIGYVPPMDTLVNGVTVTVPQEQGTLFTTGIRLLFMALPLIFGFVALIAAYRYPLSKRRLERLKDYLARARGDNGERADELAAERKVLAAELGGEGG